MIGLSNLLLFLLVLFTSVPATCSPLIWFGPEDRREWTN